MGKLPFMQFYPADFLQDVEKLTVTATGAWIKLLCQMWIAPEPGVLEWHHREFTTFLRLNNDTDTEQMIGDLTHVADILIQDEAENYVDNGEDWTFITIKSRRMVRDWAALQARKDTHKKYNDKRTTNKRQRNDIKTTDRSQKSEVRSHISEEDTLSSTSDEDSEISVKDLVESWNEIFKGRLPQVEWPLSKTRHHKCACRLKEHSRLDFWQRVFDNIGESQFLLGRSNGSWACTLDFLIANDTNCTKIYEGSYK